MAKPKQKKIDKVIDWQEARYRQLLQEASEPASAERLRRSMQAFRGVQQVVGLETGTCTGKTWLATLVQRMGTLSYGCLAAVIENN